jgi:hypothetical protein
VGGTTAVVTASVPVALAGFVLVGLGLANVFPLSISRAGVLGGARGIALATTVGYTGLLGGPPLVGLLAQGAGLPVALGTVPVLALVAGALVLSVGGDSVRLPIAPRAVVSGFGHGTAVYVRDLRALVPGA